MCLGTIAPKSEHNLLRGVYPDGVRFVPLVNLYTRSVSLLRQG